MAQNIKLQSDAPIYYDCTEDAYKIGKVYSGDIFEYEFELNGWYKIQDHCWLYIEDENKNPNFNHTTESKKGEIEFDEKAIREFDLQLFGWMDNAWKKIKDGLGIGETDSQKDKGSAAAEQTANVFDWIRGKTKEYGGYLLDSARGIINGGDIKVTSGDLRITNLYGIFGMPYQYMPHQDRRIDGGNNKSSIGRKYADKIVARMPLLVMVPGKPSFLAGYSSDEKAGILSSALDGLGGLGGSEIENMLKNPGKYYELKPDWAGYFQNVNAMAQAAAIFMGIGGKRLPGNYEFSSGMFSWQNYSNGSIQSKLNYKGGVAFYVNAEAQINESFSNSTTQSQFAEKINSISDLGREMQFLLGSNENLLGERITDTLKTDPTKDTSVAQTAANKLLSGGSLLGTITHSFDTVISGGKLIFPEIWADSTFSRDYSIDIKLVSPDNDDMSVYLNIVAPLLHLLGFVMPIGTGPSAFVSPYLVRCSYKGQFNIDMGIITSMSITKGQEGAWNHYGMPTIVDVNFTIKELYGVMALANNNAGNYKLANNTILMDYIGNLCGCNINEPDIVRTIVYHSLAQSSRPASFAKKVMDSVDQTVINSMQRLFDIH